MDLRHSGYCDNILRVDLSSGSIEREPLPSEEVMRLLLGGKGLGAYLLYKEVPPGIDPLSPENPLILNVGPLTGTTAPTAGRLGATTKSPATGTYSDSYCGGYFGQTMKYAGYDAIVISGAASEPVMLVIDDNRVEIRPAGDLWGTTIPAATEHLRAAFGAGWESLVIGPPGEKRSNIASIFNETRALARGGVGAVMGSKNLKAIVARGTGKVYVADRQRYDRALQLASRAIRMSSSITRMSADGTANILEFVNIVGALPTRNFQAGQFEQADEINGAAFSEKSWVKKYACFGCPIACSKITKPVDGKVLEGPEYETIFAVGSNCAIGSQEGIIRLSQVCDEYGMDTISAGGIIGFVMELFEKGFLRAADLDGIEAEVGRLLIGAGPDGKDGENGRLRGMAERGGGCHRPALSWQRSLCHARQRAGDAGLPPQRSQRDGAGLCHLGARRLPPARRAADGSAGRDGSAHHPGQSASVPRPPGGERPVEQRRLVLLPGVWHEPERAVAAGECHDRVRLRQRQGIRAGRRAHLDPGAPVQYPRRAQPPAGYPARPQPEPTPACRTGERAGGGIGPHAG